jgi:cellulose synthase (UDP-forming)
VVTLLAVINPKLGKFNVTDKGERIDRARFDYRTSLPTLALLGVSALALMIAFPLRLLIYGRHGLDPGELDAILINGVWGLANFVTLLAAACVAYEQPQRRSAPRVSRRYFCGIGSGEHAVACWSEDLSESGVRVVKAADAVLPPLAEIVIRGDSGMEATTEGTLVWSRELPSGEVEGAFTFNDMDSETHQILVQLMFSSDRSWETQSYPKDRVLRSFWHWVTTFWRVSASGNLSHEA